jgi:hypothetical protein
MRGKNKGLGKQRNSFLWMICLLLIVLAGGSIFYIARLQGREQNTTPSSQSLAATKQPEATVTRTVSQMPSLPLVPTPSSVPELLFSDYFLDNSNGWLTGSSSGYTRTITQGALSIAATNHKILIESLPPNHGFDDFLLKTVFTFHQGDEHDSVGLFLRGDSNLDHDYRIDLYGDNTYTLIKESLDEHNNRVSTFLDDPATTSALHMRGLPNELTVIMKGPTLVLLLNGTIVASVDDPDLKHGQIALFVQHGRTSAGVRALFHRLEVFKAPQQLPTPEK